MSQFDPFISMELPYLADVLALKLLEERVNASLLGLDADSREDLLDVVGRRGLVAAELEEEVCRKVLHFVGGFCAEAVSNYSGSAAKATTRGAYFWVVVVENKRINHF